MSGRYQEQRIRLVPLVSTLKNIAKPLLELDQILDLAASGEIRLYVRIPSDKVAYVDALLPIVIHRRSSLLFRDMGDFDRYSPKTHQLHPEVTHLALDPDHAGELKTRGHTSDMAFASGLSEPIDERLAQAGWWVPCQFGKSLVVCAAPVQLEAGKWPKGVRRHWVTTEPDDVYVDACVVSLLEDPHGSVDDDPYYLRNRAPGVYALYRAAKDNDAALKKKQISFEEVQCKLIDQLPELGKTDAGQVAKLINPRHRRNSGVVFEIKKYFDEDVLRNGDFRRRYKKESFVNDALALVLSVTERVLDSRALFKVGKVNRAMERSDIDPVFDKLGFHQKETTALTRLLLVKPKNDIA